MDKTKNQIIKEYLSERGRELGQSKSEKKRQASRMNLEKALSKRWGKTIKLRTTDSDA
jgi:hypothetical protein